MSDRQRRLPLTRGERFRALAAINHRALALPDGRPVGRRLWAHVVDLVEQIELCGSSECFAYTATLAARMAGGVGVSRATFFRVRAAAEALGLIAAKHRHNGQGQASNEWRIDWIRVESLAPPRAEGPTGPRPAASAETGNGDRAGRKASRRAEAPAGGRPDGRKARPKTETHPCQTETHPSQTETHLYRGFNSSSACSPETIDERPPRRPRRPAEEAEHDEHREPPPWTIDERDRVRQLCRSAAAKIAAPCQAPGDRSLLAKAAYLALTRLDEHWFWDAVEGVRIMRPRRPWAYLHQCYRASAEKRGLSFARLLAGVRVPAELLQPPEPRDQRLCAPAERVACP